LGRWHKALAVTLLTLVASYEVSGSSRTGLAADGRAAANGRHEGGAHDRSGARRRLPGIHRLFRSLR